MYWLRPHSAVGSVIKCVNDQLDHFRFSHVSAPFCPGFGAAWHLASVRVTNLSTKAVWNFDCDEWLSKSDGDKQISRELVAVVVTDGERAATAKGGGGGGGGDGDRTTAGRVAGGGGEKEAKQKKKTAYAVTLVTMDKKNAGI